MDIEQKRILRRKTPVLSEVVKFDSNFGRSAVAQGLLRDAQASNILVLKSNKSRIARFFQILEVLPGPHVAFEKLCFLLANLGYLWLCDELWVELICARGNLTIEESVFEEVSMLVRERLALKTNLKDDDIKELAVLIATRYQMAKETLQRQAKRSGRSRSDAGSDNSMNDLYKQLHECMDISSVSLPMYQQKDGEPSSDHLMSGNRTLGNVATSCQSPGKKDICEDYGNIQHIMASIKHKVNDVTRDFITSSSMQRSAQRDKPKGHVFHGLDTTRTRARPRNGLLTRDIHDGKHTGRTSKLKQHKSTSKKKKAKNIPQCSDDEDEFSRPDVNFDFSSSEREMLERGIDEEIIKVRRQKKRIDQMSRCFTAKPRETITRKEEECFWKDRYKVMTRCKSVGYYYFLSDRKRERCEACAKTPTTPDFCASGQCGLRKVSAGHHNLYDKNTWRTRPKRSCTVFDDSLCPGAFELPNGQTRCLACAYANNEEPHFYDAAVSSTGDRHVEFPSLSKDFTNKKSVTMNL